MAPAPGEHARPCPVSTGRGTRRVHLVRGGGGGRAPCARRAPPPSRPFSWTAISSPAAAAPPPPPATPAPHFREHPLRGAPAEAQERPLDGSAASGGHQSVLLRLLLRAPDLGRPRRKRLDLLHLSQTPPRAASVSAHKDAGAAHAYTQSGAGTGAAGGCVALRTGTARASTSARTGLPLGFRRSASFAGAGGRRAGGISMKLRISSGKSISSRSATARAGAAPRTSAAASGCRSRSRSFFFFLSSLSRRVRLVRGEGRGASD